MQTLNERAWQLANAVAAKAEELDVEVIILGCGTRIIDCGVKARGSNEAGRRLAEICLAGRGAVELHTSESKWPVPEDFGLSDNDPRIGELPPFLPRGLAVYVIAPDPVAACMASQYAGWEIKGEKFFAMGSGPMRAAAGREKLFDDINHREAADRCVGVLETAKLPPETVCIEIAEKCGIPPDRLTLLVARTASSAGTLQIVARSVETALHKLHELGFDLARVRSAWSVAPLPPVSKDDLTAIGWTNDAILYGAHVVLWVHGDDASLEAIGPQVPSSASTDHGRPFTEIFARYDHDFYRIDPLLFSPAVITLKNLDTGRSFRYGEFAPTVLEESFEK